MAKRIRRLFEGAPTPRIVIVGAGFSGIALGVKLMRAGIHSYDVYEMSAGIGGTWLDNTYPGCEVDVASQIYSYSFAHHDWSRTHASQKELLGYLERVADEFGVRHHIHCNTKVLDVTWDERTHLWTVRLSTGETVAANIVVSAVGMLNSPKYPDWPGLESFRGPKFHTARWEPQHSLDGKTVAVVGTGSTAIQLVPRSLRSPGRSSSSSASPAGSPSRASATSPPRSAAGSASPCSDACSGCATTCCSSAACGAARSTGRGRR